MLIPALKRAGGAALEARAKQGIAALASKNWTATRVSLVEQISKSKDRSPIDPDWLSLQMVEAMPDNAILVDEGLTSSRQIDALRAASRPLRLSCAGVGRHRLGVAGLGRRQPRQPRPPGGVLLRRRQRDVFDPGVVDRGASQAAADGGDRQTMAATASSSSGCWRFTATTIMSAWISSTPRWISPGWPNPSGWRRSGSPIPGELKSTLASAFSRPGAKLIEVVVDGTV